MKRRMRNSLFGAKYALSCTVLFILRIWRLRAASASSKTDDKLRGCCVGRHLSGAIYVLCLILYMLRMWLMRAANVSSSDEEPNSRVEDAVLTFRRYYFSVLVRFCVCCKCGGFDWRVQVRETNEPL